jgi:uncharacterized protein (TIGR00251 family)
MCYEQATIGYILRIRVTPNSSKCSICGIFTDCGGQDYLKVNLTSVPEKGKANSELIKLLSKTLHLSKSSFSIINGETDRYKKLLIETEISNTTETAIKELEQQK